MKEDKIEKFSEGEDFFMDFLVKEGHYFKYQKRIDGLKGDSKSYRVADFYLPHYKVYIEFLGLWGHGEQYDKGYNEKKRVYEKNNIPCVYLYPENFGILPFILNRRIIEQLLKYNKKKQLLYFRLYLWMRDTDKSFDWFMFSLLGITLVWLLAYAFEIKLIWVFAFIPGIVAIKNFLKMRKVFRYYFRWMNYKYVDEINGVVLS